MAKPVFEWTQDRVGDWSVVLGSMTGYVEKDRSLWRFIVLEGNLRQTSLPWTTPNTMVSGWAKSDDHGKAICEQAMTLLGGWKSEAKP